MVVSANIEDKGCTATIVYKNDRRHVLHCPAHCIQPVKGSLKHNNNNNNNNKKEDIFKFKIIETSKENNGCKN